MSLKVFDRLIKIGDIGLPCIIENDNVFTDWEAYLKNKGLEIINVTNASCSIGSKNC